MTGKLVATTSEGEEKLAAAPQATFDNYSLLHVLVEQQHACSVEPAHHVEATYSEWSSE